jgi:hypothetical protein
MKEDFLKTKPNGRIFWDIDQLSAFLSRLGYSVVFYSPRKFNIYKHGKLVGRKDIVDHILFYVIENYNDRDNFRDIHNFCLQSVVKAINKFIKS